MGILEFNKIGENIEMPIKRKNQPKGTVSTIKNCFT